MSRLSSLEQAQDDEFARTTSNQAERERRSHFVKEDIAVNQIQRVFRGHVGRRRFRLAEKRESADHGWTEVRDEEAGERWFYNSITGESQWEPPAVLISQAELMPKQPTRTPAGSSILSAGEEFFATDDSRPSSSSSLPPLESTRGTQEMLDSLMSTQSSFGGDSQPRPASTGAKPPRQLPPLEATPQLPGKEGKGEVTFGEEADDGNGLAAGKEGSGLAAGEGVGESNN